MKSAVIGTGRISQEHIAFISKCPCAELLAVCDRSSVMTKFSAGRLSGVQMFNDPDEMLNRVNPDVVHVLTPPHTHVAIAKSCLDAGAHVIVEKPIATSRVQFQQLWRRAQTQGCRLVEDQNYRFNRPIIEIDKLVAEGRLGEVRQVDVFIALAIRNSESRYADENLPHPSHHMPGGAIHEFLPHLCSLVQKYLLRYDRVAAAWSNHGGEDLFKYDDLDALVIGGPIHARIRFSCHTRPECFIVSVRGTEGSAQTDLFQPHLQLSLSRRGPAQLMPIINQHIAGRALKSAARRNFINKLCQRTPYEGLHTLLDRTYRALHDQTKMPVMYDDMDRTLELTEALLDESNRI